MNPKIPPSPVLAKAGRGVALSLRGDASSSSWRERLPAVVEWAILLACIAAFIAGLRLLLRWIPFVSDWEVYFRPITLGWLEGNLVLYRDTASFWNPPWLLWPLAPLAYWPGWLGWGALVVTTLFCMLWLTRKYRAWWLVFISPLIIDPIHDGQIDLIPLLGIALGWLANDRPLLLGVALVLMAAKPQACFLVALWLWLRHPQRVRALLVPVAVFVASLLIHGWDWPLRWIKDPTLPELVSIIHNASPWHSIGLWMLPVALVLGTWALRLPRTRRNLGALVAANALITPYLASYSLIQVLTFSLLPLGPVWAAAGWTASLTPLLRAWFGRGAGRVDLAVAAVMMIGYLLYADRHARTPDPGK
jgi:hypothetical protein